MVLNNIKGEISVKTKQKTEAIKRMKTLNIIPDAIKQFENKNTVMVSENGFLYEINDEQKNIIKEFEDEYNALVYIVIQNCTEFGKLYTFLYVSEHTDEWDMDNSDLTSGYPLAYIYNSTCPDFSEFGSVGIKNQFGGLIRTE